MKVSVYDTYVPKSKLTKMHFDILVEASTPLKKVYSYGKQYLEKKGFSNYILTTKECSFLLT